MHTPGPWVVSSSFLVCTKEGRVVANCTPMGIPSLDVHPHCAVSNAKAIGALPNLLSALYEAEQYFTGRADVVDGDYGVPEPNEEMKLLQKVQQAIVAAGVSR